MNNIFSKLNDLLRGQNQVNRGPPRRTGGPPKKAIPYCTSTPQRKLSFKNQQFTPNFQSPYVYKKVIDPSIKGVSNNNLIIPDITTPKHYVYQILFKLIIHNFPHFINLQILKKMKMIQNQSHQQINH